MAQVNEPSKGTSEVSSSGAKSSSNKTGDRERPQTADFTSGDAADFQVSLATATSIAGLTAYAMPLAELSAYVSDADIAADSASPLSFEASDRAPLSNLASPTREGDTALNRDHAQGTSEPANPSDAPVEASTAHLATTKATTTPEIHLDALDATGSTTFPQGFANTATVSASVEDTTGKSTWSPGEDLAASLSEDSPVGSVVIELDTQDQYGDPIDYRLVDGNGQNITDGPFQIVDNTIILSPGSELDFEALAEHAIYIMASNEGGTSGPWPLTLTITDVAEDITLGDGGMAFSDLGVAETSITGGMGDDTIIGHDDGARIDGGAGDDIATGGGGADVLSGGTGADSLSGGQGADTFTGGAGDDVLSGGAGTDIAIFSGAWADYTITEANGVFTVVDNRPGSPDGTDTLTDIEVFRFTDGEVSPLDALNDGPSVSASDGAIAENDAGAVVGTVSASDPDAGDTITLSVDDPRFEIVGGELRLRDGETLDFEDGATITVAVTATDLHGATDTEAVTITVGDTAETITLSDSGVAFTDMGVGETSITGGMGDDTIIGHDDGARIDGGAGDDQITGGTTADDLEGGTGNDSLSGGNGSDQLSGGSGNDQLGGGSGQDTLNGGAGDDLLDGGSGADVAIFSGSWADYTIAETGGTYTVTDNRPGSPDGTDTLVNVELFRFADGDVTPADALNDGPSVTATGGTIAENDAGVVVGAVSASDPDAGDTVTLSVDDARFEILNGQLKLKDGETLDYEDGATVTVTVTVTATDSHGATDSQVVTITVADTAEAITLDDGGVAFSRPGRGRDQHCRGYGRRHDHRP